MKSEILARKKGFFHKLDFAMNVIWLSKDNHPVVGNFVLVHCMNHSEKLGKEYFSCENITELNQVKSTLINNGFNVDWDKFNDAIGWLE